MVACSKFASFSKRNIDNFSEKTQNEDNQDCLKQHNRSRHMLSIINISPLIFIFLPHSYIFSES